MTVLLLAGTREARQIAGALAKTQRPAIASYAGATRQPEPLPLPTRIGGFGGAEGFRQVLRTEGITAVLDATHPFAARISARSAAICAAEQIPYAQVLRPAWAPEPGDRWTALTDEAEAAQHIPKGATVFLATGRQTLERFGNLTGRRLYCRQIDPPEKAFPFPNGEYIVGRPPFSHAEEVALFQRLRIDWLVVKNAGGAASKTKLTAARALQIPVAMIQRPPLLDALRFETAEAALDWLRHI